MCTMFTDRNCGGSGVNWSKNIPEESGWYWYHIVGGKFCSTPEICYVDTSFSPPLVYFTPFPSHKDYPKSYDSSYFYGPLPPPAFTYDLSLFSD